MDEIIVRPHTEDDKSFVFASWLNCIWKDEFFSKYVRKTTFFQEHHALVEKVLSKSKTIVAALKEDPSVILGYMVYEPKVIPIIHFCYVKATFDNSGVATRLLLSANVDPERKFYVTQVTRSMDTLSVRFRNMEYNPYLFFKE